MPQYFSISFKFNGQTKWVEQLGRTESNQDLIKYMLNAYRVLLTRARAGMVICVPSENPNKTATGFWEDSTRLPEYYDGTYYRVENIIEKTVIFPGMEPEPIVNIDDIGIIDPFTTVLNAQQWLHHTRVRGERAQAI